MEIKQETTVEGVFERNAAFIKDTSFLLTIIRSNVKESIIIVMALVLSWTKINALLKMSFIAYLVFCFFQFTVLFKQRIVLKALLRFVIFSCIQFGIVGEKDPLLWVVSYYFLFIRYYPIIIVLIVIPVGILCRECCPTWIIEAFDNDTNRSNKNAVKKLLKKIEVIIIPTNLLTQCIICKEEYKKNERARNLPCNHQFHQRCIDKWLETSGTCPICRSDIEKAFGDLKVGENKNEKVNS